MSFAQGFASTFVPMLNDTVNSWIEGKEKDAEIAWKTFLENKTLREKQKLKAAKWKREAKWVIENAGLPQDALPVVYRAISIGDYKPSELVEGYTSGALTLEKLGGGGDDGSLNLSGATSDTYSVLEEFGGPTAGAADALEERQSGLPVDDRGIDLLTRTIIGEAASEPEKGQAAVASVVLNRLNSGQYGQSIEDVLFAKNQFEPWTNPETRKRLMSISPTSPQYREARRIAEAVARGEVPDFTDGALNFANADVVRQYHRSGKASESTLNWVSDIERNGEAAGYDPENVSFDSTYEDPLLTEESPYRLTAAGEKAFWETDDLYTADAEELERRLPAINDPAGRELVEAQLEAAKRIGEGKPYWEDPVTLAGMPYEKLVRLRATTEDPNAITALDQQISTTKELQDKYDFSFADLTTDNWRGVEADLRAKGMNELAAKVRDFGEANLIEEEEFDWQDLSNVTDSNWRSLAAAARDAGDEEQAQKMFG